MEEAILKDRTLKIRATVRHSAGPDAWAACQHCRLTSMHAQIDERCPQCSFTGMEYYTAQLRSADEGQTVFFECPQCRWACICDPEL